MRLLTSLLGTVAFFLRPLLRCLTVRFRLLSLLLRSGGLALGILCAFLGFTTLAVQPCLMFRPDR